MRCREPYTLYPRLTVGGKRVYYFRVYDENGKRIARSTGQTNKAAAHAYVAGLTERGELQPKLLQPSAAHA